MIYPAIGIYYDRTQKGGEWIPGGRSNNQNLGKSTPPTTIILARKKKKKTPQDRLAMSIAIRQGEGAGKELQKFNF
jgi:hypothetical protein